MKKTIFVSVMLVVCMWISALWAEVPGTVSDPAGQALEKNPATADAVLAGDDKADPVDKETSPQKSTVAKKPPVSGINFGDPYIMSLDGTVSVAKATVFTIRAVGGVSGVARSEYRIDGGQWTAYEPFTIAAEGAHLIEYRSVDNGGNVEQIRSLPVYVDLAPPVTTLFVGAKKIEAGSPFLITRNSTITLTATDDFTGVDAIEYRIDGGPWRAYAPFTVSAKGGHTIGFRSRDKVGNLEDEKTVTAGSDKIPPKTVISVGGLQYAEATGPLYATAGTPFILTVAESISGVSRTEYSIDEGPWTAYAPFIIEREGAHRIAYRSIDRAANVETAHIISVMVDSTPPQTALYGADQELEAGGSLVAGKELNFTLRASDKMSPLKGTEYRVNDGPWMPYAPFGFTDEGEYRIQYRSTDSAGNVETAHSFTAIVDKTPPVSEITIDLPKRDVDGVTHINGTTTLMPKASDNLAGVDKMEYRIVGKGDERYTTPFSIQTRGEYRIEYQAVDKVGNLEPAKTLVVVVDDTLPAVDTPDGKPVEEVDGVKKHIFKFDEKSALAATAGVGVAPAPAVAVAAQSAKDGAVPLKWSPNDQVLSDDFAAERKDPAVNRDEPGSYGARSASLRVGGAGARSDTLSTLEYVTFGFINIVLILGVMLL